MVGVYWWWLELTGGRRGLVGVDWRGWLNVVRVVWDRLEVVGCSG